jgi:hypothetical protein
MNNDLETLATRLAAPFDPAEVKWKPQAVSGNRALAVAFVDVRVVMDRLDDVLGLGNWSTTYREIAGGIVCTLRVKIGDAVPPSLYSHGRRRVRKPSPSQVVT